MLEALWMALPFVVSLGSALIAYILVQARQETILAREREASAAARAELTHHQHLLEDRVRAVRAEARREALDEFLSDVRVEERHYVRETDTPSEQRKCVVLQERVCFRNIPLSQWTERELDVQTRLPPPEPMAVDTTLLAGDPRARRLLL